MNDIDDWDDDGPDIDDLDGGLSPSWRSGKRKGGYNGVDPYELVDKYRKRIY